MTIETKKKVKVAKSVDEELKQVTFVAMKPGVDLQGDEVGLEDIRKAKESFNAALKKSSMANLFHLAPTSSFDIIESYLAPADMVLKGNAVQSGEWLVTLQVHNDDLWEMIKNEDVNGVSIGAMATAVTLD